MSPDEPDPLALQFVTLVKSELQRQNLTQRALATRLGVSRQWVGELLSNRSPIQTSTMSQWAEALGITLELNRIVKEHKHGQKKNA